MQSILGSPLVTYSMSQGWPGFEPAIRETHFLCLSPDIPCCLPPRKVESVLAITSSETGLHPHIVLILPILQTCSTFGKLFFRRLLYRLPFLVYSVLRFSVPQIHPTPIFLPIFACTISAMSSMDAHSYPFFKKATTQGIEPCQSDLESNSPAWNIGGCDKANRRSTGSQSCVSPLLLPLPTLFWISRR